MCTWLQNMPQRRIFEMRLSYGILFSAVRRMPSSSARDKIISTRSKTMVMACVVGTFNLSSNIISSHIWDRCCMARMVYRSLLHLLTTRVAQYPSEMYICPPPPIKHLGHASFGTLHIAAFNKANLKAPELAD